MVSDMDYDKIYSSKAKMKLTFNTYLWSNEFLEDHKRFKNLKAQLMTAAEDEYCS